MMTFKTTVNPVPVMDGNIPNIQLILKIRNINGNMRKSRNKNSLFEKIYLCPVQQFKFKKLINF